MTSLLGVGVKRSAIMIGVVMAIAACDSRPGPEGPRGETGAAGLDGVDGAPGPAGLSVTTVVDRITSAPGVSVTTVPESSLSPLPTGATTRRVYVVNAILRATDDESSAILAMYPAFIDPVAVSGAHAVTVWDPAAASEFAGSGIDVLHLYVASAFSM